MATKAELLEQAENAYHLLMCGQSVVEVRDSNGESLRYTQANSGRLLAYIERLRREVHGAGSGSGPMQVYF